LKDEQQGGLSSWIEKSRLLEIEKKKVVEKEKELFGEDEYGGAELEGMRVGHKLEALMGDQDSDQVILTFRDTSVLKGNDLNEDEMVLENVEMAEKQKFDRYYEKKKKIQIRRIG